jgi:hypothetical protein
MPLLVVKMKEVLIEPVPLERKQTLLVNGERHIPIPVLNPKLFLTNSIKTCKYNWLTFIPKNM